MGVGKKIRRILSFKRKKEDKPAIEAPKPEKTNTLNGTKSKSSSLISLGRKFSFGKKDKKERNKKGTPPVPESAVPATDPVPAAVASSPLAAPEVVETVPAVETSELKVQTVTEPAKQEVEIVSNEIAAEQLSESESPLFEKVKPHDKQEDIEDSKACGDGIRLATGQNDSLGEEQSDKPAAVSTESENHCKVLSPAPAPAAEEPKTITEVISKIHDKSETNQTGDEIVRTVEVEQERTLAEDGTTVVSESTTTTTTTVDRGGVAKVSQVTTESKNKMNGHSRQISQLSSQKSSKLPLQLVFALLVAAFACAILYKYKDTALSLV